MSSQSATEKAITKIANTIRAIGDNSSFSVVATKNSSLDRINVSVNIFVQDTSATDDDSEIYINNIIKAYRSIKDLSFEHISMINNEDNTSLCGYITI